MARKNKTVTVAAGGTPINVITGLTGGALGVNLPTMVAEFPSPVYASRYEVQLLPGSTGPGYVLMGIAKFNRVPAASTSGDLTHVLEKPAAGQPGGNYKDQIVPGQAHGIDMRELWLDAASGDTLCVSWDEVETGG